MCKWCFLKYLDETPVAPVELPSVGSFSPFQYFFGPFPGAAAEEHLEGFESLQPTTKSFIRNENRKIQVNET